MRNALQVLLEQVARHGELTVITADGMEHRFGDSSGPVVKVRIADEASERALAADPSLALGEAYMDGRLEVLEGDVYELISILMSGAEPGVLTWPLLAAERARYALRRVHQHNPATRAERNVKHHYDIDQSIYDLFLDGEQQYSCAYFGDGVADIDAAQRAKMRHIAAKLRLEPGQKVLDIGCGWGGMCRYLAERYPVETLGITLSDNQLAGARERAMREGFGGRVRFEKSDYRKVRPSYERIVSVGMFEHVGVGHYKEFFDQVRRLLTADGVALLHSIARTAGPGYTNPFIRKYIFPGGYFPALSEIMSAIEASGLILGDVEVLRLHYAETLRAWRQRFMERRGEAVARRGEVFCRMWEFYLAGSEAAFRQQDLVVMQIQLLGSPGAAPITRDYMFEEERRLAKLDGDMAA
ncbi:MAG: methyltransferase domain-containing protein [Rhizobiales bacterium]|nr:methyltransferase domain-containing protein [Hyphomicrobiales bacterium]